MTRMLRSTLAMAAACATILAVMPRTANGQDAKQQGTTPTIAGIASQLGVRAQPTEIEELQTGTSFTAILENPDKLAAFGIKGMHAGARVTIARVAPDKVRVEADEVDPVSHSGSANVKLSAKGELMKPAGG